jgi:Dienelactone hydrolase family
VSAYDEDATLTVDHLLSLPTCNGLIGTTGMCLGGHLAFRCALDRRVKAAVCYFATDIHSRSLGEGMKDDSLERCGDITGEVVMVCSIRSGWCLRELIGTDLWEEGYAYSPRRTRFDSQDDA